ncbi:MAG TPA: hypothetical protein VNF26_01770 [Candidatus Baltobacterales bacterium]|nr:hypothetical protein [Candidatus Baltobacterales bacterium]
MTRRLTLAEAPELMTFTAAARVLGIGKNLMTSAVRSGRVPTVQLTETCRRIPKAALAKLLLIEEGKAG